MLDEHIAATKDVMIALKLKYDDLVEQFNNREFEIQDYIEERKTKDDASMESERRYEAVVKIQSWWKGEGKFCSITIGDINVFSHL